MLELLDCVRIVSTEAALAAAEWPPAVIVLPAAPDEVIVIGGEAPALDDPYAIVEIDRGWRGAWVDAPVALEYLATAAEWPLPSHRPAYAQGMVAHLPVKLWFESERVLFVVSHTVAAEMEDRLPAEWIS